MYPVQVGDETWFGESYHHAYLLPNGYIETNSSISPAANEYYMYVPALRRFSCIPSWNFIAAQTKDFADWYVIWGLTEKETHDEILARLEEITSRKADCFSILAKGRYGVKSLEVIGTLSDPHLVMKDFEDRIQTTILLGAEAVWGGAAEISDLR